MATTPFDGHVIAHAEYPGVWHLTREYEDFPASGGGRAYLTHCGQSVTLLAAVMGELHPLDQPETGPMPTCSECVRAHLVRAQQIA